MKLFKTVRGQLTFYFVLIFGVTLCIYSIVLYSVFARQNRAEFDRSMTILANSLSDELLNERFQPEKDLKVPFIPFSSTKQMYVEILDEKGNFVYKLRDFKLPVDQKLFEESLKGNSVFETSNVEFEDGVSDSYGTRILLYPAAYELKKYVIVVAVSLSNLERTLFKFRLIIYIAIPITLVFSSVIGWIFSKKAYAPVNELIKNSNSITTNNLDTRLPVSDSGDEISELASTLNVMLERIQKSFLVLKQFTSDASHELRTPLTILKGEIEVALSKERSAAEYENILKDNLDEVGRLQKIVDGLLTLSQAESGKIKIQNEKINLDELLAEAVSKITYLARKKNIGVILKFDDITEDETKQFQIRGDYGMLLNVFINLLDNAVKYSNPDSKIICSEILSKISDEIIITIEDTGIGISPDKLENIFERFYRADFSRTRDSRNGIGIGLGLAIARTIIIAHGGKIRAESTLGKGTVFTITLQKST